MLHLGIATLCCLALAPAAQAAPPGISLGLDVPATAQVGQANVPASLLITATGDTPLVPLSGSDFLGVCNSAGDSAGCGLIGSPWDRGILLTPSCAQASGPATTTPICQVPDAGVFSISSTATGSGSACAGTTFDVTPVDAALGTVRLTPRPAGSRLLLGASGSSCLISFTIDVLRLPADADAGTGGAQTRSFASAGAEYNNADKSDHYKPAPVRAVGAAETTVAGVCVPPATGTPPSCTGPPPLTCEERRRLGLPPPPECATPPPLTCEERRRLGQPPPPECGTPRPLTCEERWRLGQPLAPECRQPNTGSDLVRVSIAMGSVCANGPRPTRAPGFLGRLADKPFNVTVTAEGDRRAFKRVEFFRNDRKIRTLTRTNGGPGRYVLPVLPSRLRTAGYRITARVTLVSSGRFTFTRRKVDLVHRMTTPRFVTVADCRPDRTTG